MTSTPKDESRLQEGEPSPMEGDTQPTKAPSLSMEGQPWHEARLAEGELRWMEGPSRRSEGQSRPAEGSGYAPVESASSAALKTIEESDLRISRRVEPYSPHD